MKLSVLVFTFCSIFHTAIGQNTHSNTSLFFIDKSVSVNNNDAIEKKNKKIVLGILKERVKNNGDKVIVSMIFKNTAHAGNSYELIYNLPPNPSYDGLSSMKRERTELEYQLLVREYNLAFAKKVLRLCFEKSPDQSETNLFGTLKIMADVVKENPTNNIEAFYFSDMCECHLKKYYCDGGKEFSSYKEASESAEKDLIQILDHYRLKSTDFKGIRKISVFLPTDLLEQNPAFEMMPVFWSKLFSGLNIKSINIE